MVCGVAMLKRQLRKWKVEGRRAYIKEECL